MFRSFYHHRRTGQYLSSWQLHSFSYQSPSRHSLFLSDSATHHTSHSFQYFFLLESESNRRRIFQTRQTFVHRLSSSASIPLFFAQRPSLIVSTFADRVHRKSSFCFLSTSILQPPELSDIFFERLSLYCLVTVKRPPKFTQSRRFHLDLFPRIPQSCIHLNVDISAHGNDQ